LRLGVSPVVGAKPLRNGLDNGPPGLH
jgi:hypothetical protein